jgi:hypothetical protein
MKIHMCLLIALTIPTMSINQNQALIRTRLCGYIKNLLRHRIGQKSN